MPFGYSAGSGASKSKKSLLNKSTIVDAARVGLTDVSPPLVAQRASANTIPSSET